MEITKEEKRGKAIAAMDLVEDFGDYLVVKSASLRGKQTPQKVAKDEKGNVLCDCLSFTETRKTDSKYRCEHIYAVKYALTEFRNKLQGNNNTMATKETTATNNTTRSDESSERLEQPEQNHSERDWFDRLHDTVPPNKIQQLKVSYGSGQVPYVSWDYVANELDGIVGHNWDFTIKSINIHDATSTVYVVAAIAINLPDGNKVVREGVGASNSYQIETAIKGAASDALKRAGVLFGIARELYTKEDAPENFSNNGGNGGRDYSQHDNQPQRQQYDNREPARQGQGQGQGNNGGQRSFQNNFQRGDNPVSTSLSDLITAKQLGMIRALARELGIDADEDAEQVMGCVTDSMSKKAASAYIQLLQDRQQNGGQRN